MTTQIKIHTAEHIKMLVDAGYDVRWASPFYTVIKDRIGQYLIKCAFNDHCIGLTHTDGVTLNGREGEFYIA
jgi:hypothetical protein